MVEGVTLRRVLAVQFIALPALALAFLSSCGPADQQSSAALLGEWNGHVAWRDGTTPLTIHIAAEGDSFVATLDAPALGVTAQSLGKLSYGSPRVHFAVADSAAEYVFDGWLRRGLIVGAFSHAGVAGQNPSLLPQLSLKRHVESTKPSPWPKGVVGGAPPVAPARERSLVEWLSRR